MKISLNLRRLKEHRPNDGDEIVYLHVSGFYGTFEFRYGTVEWQWTEMLDGSPTGSSISWTEGDVAPEGHSLDVLIKGQPLEDTLFWCLASEVNAVLDKADEASCRAP